MTNLSDWYRVDGDMAHIKLRGKRGAGKESVVDLDAIPEIEKHTRCWQLNQNGYVIGYSRVLKKDARLHRVVMGFPGDQINHIDEDKKNNQKCNLEAMSNLNNCVHSKCTGSSVYPGVYFDKSKGKWRAEIDLYINGKQQRKRFPRTSDEKDSARMYRDFVLEKGLITRQPECWKDL